MCDSAHPFLSLRLSEESVHGPVVSARVCAHPETVWQAELAPDTWAVAETVELTPAYPIHDTLAGGGTRIMAVVIEHRGLV